MNINISKINFTGYAPKTSQVQQKQRSVDNIPEDVFVKSDRTRLMEKTAYKHTSDPKKECPISDEEISKLNELSKERVAKTKELLLARNDCACGARKLQEQKLDEVTELYKSKAKVSPKGGKIVMQGNKMYEYGADNKRIARTTVFTEHEEPSCKRSLFGRLVKTKITITEPRIKEFNNDGTQNIITQRSCTIGYRKNPDGSEEYKSKLVLGGPQYEKYYSEGYHKDTEGNETFEKALYDYGYIYAEGEKRSKDGSVSIENIYEYISSAQFFGAPPEFVYTGYKEDPKGNISCREKSICAGNSMFSYTKGYTKTTDDEKSWSKYYEKDDSPKKDSRWKSYIPHKGF